MGFTGKIDHELGVFLIEEGIHHLAGLGQEPFLAHEHINRDDDADNQAEQAAGKVHGIVQHMGNRVEHQIINLIDDILHRHFHGMDDLRRHAVHSHQMGDHIQQLLE